MPESYYDAIPPEIKKMSLEEIEKAITEEEKKIKAHEYFEDPPSGLLFADPRTLPGEYKPAKAVDLRAASAYAKKVKDEEGRDVTSEELQQFVIREADGKGMTYEDMMTDVEEYRKMKESYQRGEVDDGMSDDCRQNWIDKCNS